jgi:hypothetical protein
MFGGAKAEDETGSKTLLGMPNIDRCIVGYVGQYQQTWYMGSTLHK